MKIHVDKSACSGHARCAAVAPNVFTLDDEGYNRSDDYEVPEGQLVEASRGVLACPEQAISLIGDDGQAISQDILNKQAALTKR